MRFVRFGLGLACLCSIVFLSPVLARASEPESSRVYGAGEARSGVSAFDTHVITITLMGFAPDVISIYTDEPVEWRNLLPATAHLIGGTPYKAHLPWILSGTSGQVGAGSSSNAFAEGPVSVSNALSATIAPGASFVYTFTTVGD